LGLIGTGNIAKHHVEAMADLKSRGLGGFEVTAVCDVNERYAQGIAEDLEERFGIRPAVYVDYQDMLSQEEMDGVDLCLPHGLHHTVSIDCMESGVHVLCEKPLGVTIRACKRIAEAAERTGCVVSTAVPKRRELGQRTARWVFNESRLIGEPLTFFHYLSGPLREVNLDDLPRRHIWRRNRLISGGRHIMDSGFHYCDTMRYFFGEVEKVYAELREFARGEPRTLIEDGIEDTAFVTLTFENGLVGTWSFGMVVPGQISESVVFYGTEGSFADTTKHPWRIFHLFTGQEGRLVRRDMTELSFAELEEMYLRSLTEEEEEHLFPGGARDGFALEIWEFIEVVRGNREAVEIDAMEGLRTQAVCEAIYESAYSGEVVDVADVISGKVRSYQAPIDEHWGL
jgi:predicted dehydrogenase